MAVEPADVRGVLGGSDLSDTRIESFIGAASRLYDRRTDGQSVDPDVVDDVVEHLAAHLIASGPERQISSAREGDGRVSFEGETGDHLDATTHGQTAVMLDPTGSLAGATKPSATVSVPDAKGIDR